MERQDSISIRLKGSAMTNTFSLGASALVVPLTRSLELSHAGQRSPWRRAARVAGDKEVAERSHRWIPQNSSPSPTTGVQPAARRLGWIGASGVVVMEEIQIKQVEEGGAQLGLVGDGDKSFFFSEGCPNMCNDRSNLASGGLNKVRSKSQLFFGEDHLDFLVGD